MTKKNARRIDYRRFGFLFLWIFVAVFLFAFLAQRLGKIGNNTNAANLGNFQAGYIISDWQMTDYKSMSETEIQNWLNSKNSCGNTNYNYYKQLSASSSYHWHFENGHFICLSQEHFGDKDGEIGFQYKETAAHIIWQAAQDYKINPKVLLVLLQKETGLITDPIPNDWDYRRAAGYGCPDTAACSEKYYGFKNQVRNAAYLFRIVMDGNSFYYPIGNNYVQYNPNAGCGGSIVNIKNLATSALYRYTPYQPNEGALAAGYGTAPCGAYGNRNFYAYFEDWFGGITDTQKPAVEAKTKFEKPVKDGIYQLVPKSSSSKTIDVPGGVKAGMTSGKLSLYAKRDKNNDNQQFQIKYDSKNGYYSIVNPVTGLAFDVNSNGTRNSTPVGLWSQHDGCNQDWLFEADKDGFFTIVSRCSSRVLDVTAAGELIIYDSHGGNNQKWQLVKIEDEFIKEIDGGTYQIVSKAYKDKTLDIYGGVYAGMTSGKLGIYARRDSNIENQKFKITYDAQKKYFSIINPLTGISLDVNGSHTENSTAVGVWSYHGACNQSWDLVKDDEGYFSIFSRCSDKALDVTVSGKLIIYDSHGGNNQKWQLIKIK